MSSLSAADNLENENENEVTIENRVEEIPLVLKEKVKKPKKSKKPQDTQPQLTKVEYETRIVILNNKLAKLRTIVESLDTSNQSLNKSLIDEHENYLKMELMLRHNFEDMERKTEATLNVLQELEKQSEEEDEKSKMKLSEMQTRYAKTEKALLQECESLRYKLQALSPYEAERSRALKELDSLIVANKIEERKHLETLNRIVQRGAVQRYMLRTQARERLEMLQEQVSKCSEEFKRRFERELLQENVQQAAELSRLSRDHLRKMKQFERKKSTFKERFLDHDIMQDSLTYAENLNMESSHVIEKLKLNLNLLRTAAIESSKYSRYCVWLRHHATRRQRQYNDVDRCEEESRRMREKNELAFKVLQTADSVLTKANIKFKNILEVVRCGLEALLEEELSESEIQRSDKRRLMDYRGKRKRIALQLSTFLNNFDANDSNNVDVADIYAAIPKAAYRVGALGFLLRIDEDEDNDGLKDSKTRKLHTDWCLTEFTVRHSSESAFHIASLSSTITPEDSVLKNLKTDSSTSSESMLLLYD